MEQITSGTRALPKLKVISGLPSKESGTREASCPRRSPDSVTLAPLESALTSGAMCNLGVSHLSLWFFFSLSGRSKLQERMTCKMKPSVRATPHGQASAAADLLMQKCCLLFI